MTTDPRPHGGTGAGYYLGRPLAFWHQFMDRRRRIPPPPGSQGFGMMIHATP